MPVRAFLSARNEKESEKSVDFVIFFKRIDLTECAQFSILSLL